MMIVNVRHTDQRVSAAVSPEGTTVMNRRLRTALAVTAAFGAGLLMTACEGSSTSAASGALAAAASPTAPAVAGSSSTSGTAASAVPGGDGKNGAVSGGSGAEVSSRRAAAGSDVSDRAGTGTGTGSGGATGDKKGSGQVCGTNDLSWKASSETQAGGYFLVRAKAKSGITCVLPAALPVVAFGSDGTAAAPAEQSAGQPITLHAGVTAYAGVNPKTTTEDGGKELDSLIVSVSDDDPNPVSLKVGPFVVDKPIVTSWHTSAADAVPFAN